MQANAKLRGRESFNGHSDHLPFNRQAEQAILGCALVDPDEVIPRLKERLRPKHFHLRAHRVLYETLIEMHERGQPIDLITVGDRLEEKGLLGEVGGHTGVSRVANAMTTTTSVPYYMDILIEKHRRREVLMELLGIYEEVTQGDGELNGTLERLRRLVGEAEAEEEEREPIPIVYFEDLREGPEAEWLVEELLAHPRIVGLGGKRASLKTWIGLHIALCVSSGEKVFGKYTVLGRAPVLYLNEENPPELISKRLRELAAGSMPPPPGTLAIAHFTGINLRKPEGVARLKSLMKRTLPKLLVIDSIARIWGVREECNNIEITESMQALRKISEEHNCTVLYLHHLRKTPNTGRDSGDILETMRGGSEIVNLSDAVFVLKRRSEQEKFTLVRQGKNRDDGELSPFKVNLEVDKEEGTAALTWEESAADAESEVEACAQAILLWFEEKPSGYIAQTAEVAEAMRETGYTRTTVERALRLLVKDGLLDKPKRGRYTLATWEFDDDQDD